MQMMYSRDLKYTKENIYTIEHILPYKNKPYIHIVSNIK